MKPKKGLSVRGWVLGFIPQTPPLYAGNPRKGVAPQPTPALVFMLNNNGIALNPYEPCVLKLRKFCRYTGISPSP